MASSSRDNTSSSHSAVVYESVKKIMDHEPEQLYAHMAPRFEAALGQPLPQMEVRLHNVSVSADIVVKDDTNLKPEVPTLANTVKMAAVRLNAKKHLVTKSILRNFSGVLKPGSMTLVLGQPGSGKSSLLKLMAGRLSTDRRVRVDGEVTYNGVPQDELCARLPQFVSLVDQQDKHFPTLTVKETLEFAHACTGSRLSKQEETLYSRGTAEQNQAAQDALRAAYEHYQDVVIRLLGLEACQDTIVGNAMLRGVSGGERKRVATGEMAFGNKFVLLMDEISTGLDSAATFDIISTQRSLATTLRKTVAISLLQPSPEVFALFYDVILLNDGYVLYHGPASEAQAYFERLGFRCPENRDVADFLLDLGTNKQQQYEVGPCPVAAREFADAFDKSTIRDIMMAALNAPMDAALLSSTSKFIDARSQFQQGFGESTLTLLKRELTVSFRDRAALKSRFLMALVLGLLHGSTYYQFDDVDPQLVVGMAFVTTNLLGTSHRALISAVMSVRDVIYKQRGANFYRTSSYVIAHVVSQASVGLMETVVFGSCMYWLCGFIPTAAGFILFELVLFFVNMVFAALFFFISSLSLDLNVAFPLTQLILLFYVTFSGYVMTMDMIPDYMIWVYWLSPLAWGVRALAVIEYTDSRFATCTYRGTDYCERYGMQAGEYLLNTYGVPAERYCIWYALVYLAASYVFFIALSAIVLEYWRYESPKNLTQVTETATNDELPSLSESYHTIKSPTAVMATRAPDVAVSIASNTTRSKHFVPVTLAFKDLWYSVPDPASPKSTIDLPKGVSGFALPGTITALMGSSGAGKTTLMDVIAGRKSGGQIRGAILLNGHPATDLAIRRATGYCEQMDIHSDASTFREALTFSAFLRQDADVPDTQKYDSVNECLELLDLHPIADQIIRGSSTEQMKRLTMGVELAAQPSVLFLDEPTSGLDARSAKLIMDGVRKVADTGRTVVCTIHQPSAVVFEVFDSLLLLKRGGEMVFFGDLGAKAMNLINYFESIDGVAKMESGSNPATWMLEVIGAGVGNDNGSKTDFVSLFRSSAQFRQLESDLNREGVARPSPSLPALEFKRKRAASNWVQAAFLTKRWFHLYWRTPSYNITRFIVSLILGLVFGIAYVGAEYSSYQGINSGMGMIFMAASYITFFTFSGVIPITFKERATFYRERAAETYSVLWYLAGGVLVEIPYCFFTTLLFVAVFTRWWGSPGLGTASHSGSVYRCWSSSKGTSVSS